ncbi:MAG: hypothetical protein RL277_1067, partial [Planctomycetota bacterium]
MTEKTRPELIDMDQKKDPVPHQPGAGQQLLEKLIFGSRWIQAPLYVGLTVAGVIYAYKFAEHLWHMIHGIQSLDET